MHYPANCTRTLSNRQEISGDTITNSQLTFTDCKLERCRMRLPP